MRKLRYKNVLARNLRPGDLMADNSTVTARYPLEPGLVRVDLRYPNGRMIVGHAITQDILIRVGRKAWF